MKDKKESKKDSSTKTTTTKSVTNGGDSPCLKNGGVNSQHLKEPVVNGNCDHKTSSSTNQEDNPEINMEVVKKNDVNKQNSSDRTKEDMDETKSSNSDQEFIFIHDTGFTIKIAAPCLEPFEMQVSAMELVQEIHHFLMDREDTCHRTCFSLRLNDMTLDNFCELKNIEGLKDGSVIRVVEEPYTVREARIHVRHVRDLLKSLDPIDAYNGVDCSSLSFLSTIAQGDVLIDKKGQPRSAQTDAVDCTPPDYIIPGCKDRLISPLQPQAKEQKNPSALKVLTMSGWNPPPGNRRLQGDLMYLFVVTQEDKRFHITSSTRGFYVNVSTEEDFNPVAANPKVVYHSLIELLNSISPLFKRNFANILKKRQQRHPFERVATPYQVYSWTSPHFDHTIDAIRAEDAFSSKLGYEEHIPGQTRDWNEELQTTRELPRKSLPERLLRERAVFKVHSDFVAAATRGAIAVIDGNVMAINPGEETKMQMFIWNNIFFSLGFDVRDHYKELGGDAAAFVAPSNDLQGVKAYCAVDVEGLYTLGTIVIDYRGYRVTAQSIIPGILEREQEQSVVYGSVDFGKTVVTNEKYLELLGKAAGTLKILPHTVINDKGELVEICSSVECKGIIGNDGRYYILDLLRTFPPDVNFLNVESMESEGVEYSKAVQELGFPRAHRHKLACLRQELVDAFFERRYMTFIKLAAQCLQQLNRQQATVNNNEPSEKCKTIEEKTQELIEIDEDTKAQVNGEVNGDVKSAQSDSLESNTKEIVKKAALAVGSLKESEFDIRFNPDVYSEGVKHSESPAQLKHQRQLVHDASEMIITTQIPSFIRDCRDNSIAPMDGITLTEAIHNRGINVRYLGVIADMLSKASSKQLEYLNSIVITELITRAAKHLFVNYLQGLEMTVNASAIAHFLNCFLSSCSSLTSPVSTLDDLTVSKSYHHHYIVNNSINGNNASSSTTVNGTSPSSTSSANSSLSQSSSLTNGTTSCPTVSSRGKKNKTRPGRSARSQHSYSVPSSKSQDKSDWTLMTQDSFWVSLRKELDTYFKYVLIADNMEDAINKFGLQKISLLRSFCLKTGIQLSLKEYSMDSRSKGAFTEEDIINVFPVVKHIHPRATDAYTFYTTGQTKIQQGFLKEGYELISEALNLLNNVYGAMHPEIAQCLRMLARLNYIMGDHAEATAFQQKAVLMSEKVNGIDHPYTITEYAHLALYCFANSQVTVALKLLYRARYLLVVVSGETHPEMAVLDSNIGLILHAVGEYDLSLRFLINALDLNVRYFGARSLKVAVSYHLVARTQSCQGDFRGALSNEKETYGIYRLLLGEEHEKTKESSECLRHLTQQAVVLQKKMNEMVKGNASAMIPPIQIQSPSLSAVLEVLNIINGIVSNKIAEDSSPKYGEQALD